MANNSSMALQVEDTRNAGGIKARRALAYVVLVLISILCLFWFYVLFINSTRSNSDLTSGFRPIPSTQLFVNIKNVLTGTQPVGRGLINSLIIASFTALLSTYFSTMTAYAIHSYEFKL